MGWLTRIKGSLLSKIKKKIPTKDLESIEKTRQEKKIKKIETNKVELGVHKEEKKTEELAQEPIKKKRNFFGLYKKKEKIKDVPKVEKDPEKKKSWFQKLKTGLFKSS